MPDLCTKCGHAWHGLTCGWRTDKYDWNAERVDAILCDCPSQFGNPSTLDLVHPDAL